jgi:hypothetical protein
MLHRWHHPSRYIPNLVRAFTVLLLACHPLFFGLFAVSFVYFFSKRKQKIIFLILPTAMLNLIFWIPNPLPGRHFLSFAPLVALSVGVLFSSIYESRAFKIIVSSTRLYLVVAIVILLSLVSSECYFPVVRAHYPWKFAPQNYSSRVPIRSMIINKFYTERYYHRASRLAQDLIKLPTNGKPIIVIADPYPILLWLKIFAQERFQPHTQIDELRAYTIDCEKNRFIIVSIYRSYAQQLLREKDIYHESFLIVDSYNPLIGFDVEPFRKDYVIISPGSM